MQKFIEADKLYPLKFRPEYFPRVWGGCQLKEVLGRDVPESTPPIGESWELVDRGNLASMVGNGPLKGHTINELVRHYGRELVGRSARDAERFPLLVKLIDAGERLSLQVHPDADACARLGHGAEPKTEVWYVISAQPGATIMAGLNRHSTKQLILSSLNNGDVEKYLQIYPSLPGDAYYIPAGTLHAIGGGNLLLEIQQNSDTTYRLSDWGRRNADGTARELHLEQGIAATNFISRVPTRVAGVVGVASHNRKFDVINNCPFFALSDLRLATRWNDATNGGSFHLLSAINAGFTVEKSGCDPVNVAPGESVLLPANFESYTLVPDDSGECRIIKTTL